MIDVATHLVLLFASCIEDGSTFTVVGDAPVAAPHRARIVVEVEDSRATPEKPMLLPVRPAANVPSRGELQLYPLVDGLRQRGVRRFRFRAVAV